MATAIIQARMGSTRLPGKVLRGLGGRSVLGWVVRAADESRAFDRVVVATTTLDEDDAVESEASALGVEAVRGPVDDVLSRFLLLVDAGSADPLVRLTADCPLLDPAVIAMVVGAFDAGDVDYLSTTHPRSLPRGLDVEAFSADTLRKAGEMADGTDRVHVTSCIYRNPVVFKTAGLIFHPRADDLRVTLDTPADAELIEAVVAQLGDRPPRWRELVDLLRKRPDIAAINAHVRQKQPHEG
ncbi:MAG: 3-deoxy-manno-octulosonate cytidylyltransferase [Acidimicrobiales bacterium]|nr:MAG: spore coat protein [Actinomycetota bacterium]MBV6509508.1 3-deoxy-manno-octulosonate cytidylyltransferase [Acidimicrobiales bacterium]RIK06621.1 MAG: spore coat protein [Acidobacteriota bacterium]